MKYFPIISVVILCVFTITGFSQTYTTGAATWTDTWTQSAGAFDFTNGVGLYSFNSGGNDGATRARFITTDGTAGGTATTLNPGQKLSIRLAGQDASGRTGISSGGRIGFALRTNSSLYYDNGTASVYNRYNESSILRVEFIGGNSLAQFTNSGGTSTANMPNFTTFKSGVTYEVEIISDKEFNIVVGGTRNNVQSFANSGGAVRQIAITNISSNMDGLFTNLTVANIPVNVTSNTGETFTVTGVISNNGATTNTLEKNGAGTVILTGQNTFTGLTTVNSGVLQLNRSGGATIPATNNITVNGGTLQVSSNQVVNDLTISSGTLTVDAGVTLTINGSFNGGGTIVNNGTIVLVGPSTFPGATTTITTMNNLQINRAAGVALDKSLTIGGILTLTTGALSIGSNTLTVNGAIAGSGTLTGSSTSNLTIGGTAGILNFTSGSRAINNLTLSVNTASATLGTALDVYGNIDLNDGFLDMAGMAVTLKSNTTHTATIDQLLSDGSNLSGATNVTAERFIKLRGTANGTGTSNGGRAYRVLGSTVTTSTTINANWQNGESNTVAGTNINNNNPLYGTQISGAGGSGNGFDVTTSNQPSLFTFTPGINILGNINYPAVTNTNVNTLDAKTGYFLYLRGDRATSMTEAYNPLGGMSTSSTTLKATGAVQKGTINYTISNSPAAFTLVTNPYPAPLDWDAVYAANSANITAFYTFWNSNTGIEGAFEVVPLASPTRRYIQPGQGFFVESTGGTTTLTITESMKAVGNNNNGVFFTNTTYESFNVELYLTEANGNRHTADAVQVRYDNNYSAGPDAGDANEINNWKENIAISRNGTRLAFESRPVIVAKDTIPLFMNKMRQANYELVFTPSMFTNTALKAELVDNFLNTRTLLSVTDSVAVPFTITADPASAATDRFMVVFGTFGPLAIDVITINARQKNNGIQVDWTAKSEKDMDRYEVERSADGIQFSKQTTTTAIGNSNTAVNYGWFDAAPHNGNNFYRIKAFDKYGLIRYTAIVKVTTGKVQPVITVYPNPVTGKLIGIKLNNVEQGSYTVSLVNNLGQRVYTGQLQHGGGSALRSIDLGTDIARGNYILTVTGAGGIQFTEQLIKH